MAHGTNTITAPVTMPQDIAAVLGISGTDLATLCQSVRINKWAKFKPQQWANKGIIPNATRQQLNYGLVDIPSWARLAYMCQFMFSTNRGSLSSTLWPLCDQTKGSLSQEYWVYQHPTSYFRLSDFSDDAKNYGYLHNAEPQVGEIETTEIEVTPKAELRIRYKNGATSPASIKYSELNGLSRLANYHFGIIATKNSSTYYVGTQETTLSELEQQGAYIDVPPATVYSLRNIIEGTWKISPILCAQAITFSNNPAQYDPVEGISLTPWDVDTVNISIRYAQIDITNAYGYRDLSSSQHYVRVIMQLHNTEQEAGTTRYYRATVKLYNSAGVEQTDFTGGAITGSVNSGATVQAQFDLAVQRIWSSLQNGYFSIELTMDASADPDVKFYRDSAWGMTHLTDEDHPL